MGQATRTTKLLLDLGQRRQGGANTGKRAFLAETVAQLTAARAFYIDFFQTHADKLAERVSYYSEKHLEMRERAISANELLTWAEACTVATKDHPHPWPGWNFSARFADLPVVYRRSVIKDAIGKVRSYLSNRAHWEASGKKQGKPGLSGASEHPTLYQGPATTAQRRAIRCTKWSKRWLLGSMTAVRSFWRFSMISGCRSLWWSIRIGRPVSGFAIWKGSCSAKGARLRS